MQVHPFNPTQPVKSWLKPNLLQVLRLYILELGCRPKKNPKQAWLILYKIDYPKYQNIKPPNYLIGFRCAYNPNPTHLNRLGWLTLM